MNIPIIGVSGSSDWLFNSTQGVVNTMKKVAQKKGFKSKVQSQFISIGSAGHDKSPTMGFQVLDSNGKPRLLSALFPDYAS